MTASVEKCMLLLEIGADPFGRIHSLCISNQLTGARCLQGSGGSYGHNSLSHYTKFTGPHPVHRTVDSYFAAYIAF